MQDNRASKSYKNFVEVICVYMDTFEGIISIDEILRTPYPLFYDVLLKQLERKKKKQERLKQNRDTLVGTTYSAGDFR
jgi:hypothetical protein